LPSLQSALLLATLGVISFFCFLAFGFVVISIYPPTVKALFVVFSAVHFNLFVSFSFSFLISPRFVSRADYSRFDFYSSSALAVLVLL
jgi:hypothetical protein